MPLIDVSPPSLRVSLPTDDLRRVLADLAAVLGRRNARWYLFGAQAAVVWGYPRLSADIDVTVELASTEVEDLVADFASAGFRARVSNLESFVRETRVVPLFHESSEIPVDLVLAGPGLEELFLDRARMTEIGRGWVPVISPEDLVVTKILAGRSKDLEDIRGVIARQGDRLDHGHMRSLLNQLEQALDRRDLLPILESELQRPTE